MHFYSGRPLHLLSGVDTSPAKARSPKREMVYRGGCGSR